MRGNFILRRAFNRALGTAAACVMTFAPALAQPAPQEKPVMVEDVFKNVQVLKGIPVNQFMDTMGFFAAALGLNCTGCHVAESLQNWDKFAEDVPRKRMARVMIQMKPPSMMKFITARTIMKTRVESPKLLRMR